MVAKAPDVQRSVTPSGLEIEFQPEGHKYKLNGEAIPAVSDILDVLDKKGLGWWGMEIGVESTQELLKRGYAIERMSKDEVVQALNRTKLTVNHVRNKAGDRGSSVHKALEIWAADGTVPDPEMFPESEKGYIQGLCNFLRDAAPEALAAEVMVGSVVEGFAGRYDLRLKLDRDRSVVSHLTPKKSHTAIIHKGIILVDLKTSAHVYDSHYLQIEAYEGASLESGYRSSDHRAVLRVSKDGRYELKHGKATYNDFLAVKKVYDALQSMKGKR